MPQRIQRKRETGWRKPEGVVNVTRGSQWGNPYRVGKPWRGWRAALNEAHAVAMFAELLEIRPDFKEQIRRDLAGKDLMCYCAPGAICHGDYLIFLANRSAS